jgi:hypothetical protein
VRVRVIIPAIAVMFAACGTEPPPTIRSTELQPSRSTLFGDSVGPGALSSVFGVAVSDEGHVFVSEPSFSRVVEFNADGSYAGVLGGPGDGPGEFRAPGSLFWRGDSLAVSDFSRGISIFTPDGSYQAMISFSVPSGDSPFGLRPILPLADGAVAAFAPASMGSVSAGQATDERWLRATPDGVVSDTLVVLSLRGRYYSLRLGDAARSGLHPFASSTLLTAPPAVSSLVVVERPPATGPDSSTFTVHRIDLHGDTISTSVLPYLPRALSSSSVDSVALAMAERWADRMDATAPALARAIENQIEWPAYLPPVTEALAGNDGSVWIRREALGADTVAWEILNADLERAASVRLPASLELKTVYRDRVYGIELDSFDVPTVVRFEVVR